MKYFSGEIGGKRLSSFNSTALQNLEKYDERLEIVEEILNDEASRNFFIGYIEEYYNVSPNMTDYLSEQDAVLNLLELFATYLLSSKDIESERKVEYKFWKSIRDFKKSEEYKSSINESLLSNGNDEDNRVEIIDMFVDKKNRNMKKPKDIKISQKDVKKNVHIAELHDAIKYVNSEVGEKNIKKKVEKALSKTDDEKAIAVFKRVLNNYKSYMRKYVASMKDDQILIKKAQDVVIDFNSNMVEGGFPIDWTKIDISNRKVFVELLSNLNRRDIMSLEDMGVITYDLYHFLLKSAELSDREIEIIKLFGLGLEQKKISDELGLTKSTLQSYINRIHQKILKLNYTIE